MLKVKETLAKIVSLLNYTKTPYVNQSATDVSCPTGTTRREFANFTLPEPGLYLVRVLLQFNANNSGTRLLEIGKTSGGGAEALTMKDVRISSGSGQHTPLQCVFLREITAAEKLYINGWQNSGSTITAVVRWQYVRLR